MDLGSAPTPDQQATTPGTDPRSDEQLVRCVIAGEREPFEELIRRHQGRVFATVRRYARHDHEVEDICQEVFLKAFERLPAFRFEAPFDHWLMRITVRTCYDALRTHQRSREFAFSELTTEEEDWLARAGTDPREASEHAAAARSLVDRLLATLPPDFRLVIQLLEIEEKTVKEIHALTGWSIPLIKVRAFRARAAMRRALARLRPGKYL